MAQSFSSRIAALQFSITAVQESKRGRPAEREMHIANLEAEIVFLRNCEQHKAAIAAIFLGGKS